MSSSPDQPDRRLGDARSFLSRRAVLRTGASSVAVLAGCLDPPGSTDPGPTTAMAAFFALADWSRHVVGDEIDISVPVPTGEMGHGWDPDADFVTRVAEADAFIYLGNPEFQWALDIAGELERDHPDVARIDGMAAISPTDLRAIGSDEESGPPTSPDTFDEEEIGIATFELHVGNDVAAEWHGDHWDGSLPLIPRDGDLVLEVVAIDEEGRRLPFGEDVDLALAVDVEGEGAAAAETANTAVVLRGELEGSVAIVISIDGGGATVFDTADDPLETEVVADPDTKASFYDPHVWVDPVIAYDVVGHIAEELGSLDGANAETYRENGEAYAEELTQVDAAFEALMADAELDVAVHTGHDSFGYLEDRYGFELRTPVGVSPDAVESFDDVADLATVIDEHGIETILYDPFEAPDPEQDLPNATEVLLENSDAREVSPLTAVEATTTSWEEAGYGWIEQMIEINIPSLRAALKAGQA